MAGFNEIIGHEDIIRHLQNAIASDKVSHAYIFSGPDRSGKMMLAEAFAQTLQCENAIGAGRPEPCMECHSCKQAASRNHPDIIYLRHEKPNTISVDDVRDQVNADIGIKPYQGKYKVYIIDEAEKMNTQAQNALLKTIEEPPSYAVILLLTTNEQRFLPTILSRCVTLSLGVVSDEQIKAYLMEKCQVPDYQAKICVAFAQGNVGKAIELASSEHFEELKGAVLGVARRVYDLEYYELADVVRDISEYKLEINDFFDLLMVWYRDVLMFKATSDANKLIFKDEVYDVKRQAERSSYHGIECVIEALQKAKARLDANVNFDLTLELLLLTMKEN